MRKTNVLLFGILLPAFLACKKIDGEGPVVTETRNLTGFDEVKSDIPDEVYITPGNTYALTIEGQQNIINMLETRLEGSRLLLRFRNSSRIKPNVKVTVRITAPSLKAFIISGSGNIHVADTLKTSQLGLNISGSGDMHLNAVVAEHINTTLSGSGNMDIKGGSAASSAINLNGSGDVDFRELVAANTEIKVSGSGDSWLQVTGYLKVKISGSGDVNYKGSPRMDVDVTGSGKLKNF